MERVSTFHSEGHHPAFIGREHELDAMREWGKEPGPPLLISGPFGSGKTSLVMEYARRTSAQYSRVFAITVNRFTEFLQTMPTLFTMLDWAVKRGEKLHPEGPIQELSYGGAGGKQVLVIFDEVPANHDQVELIAYIRRFRRDNTNIRWIVITRSTIPSIAVQPGPDYYPLTLPGLSAVEIERLLGMGDGIDLGEVDLQIVKQFLHQRLDGNPRYVLHALKELQEQRSIGSLIDLDADIVSEGVTSLIITPTKDRLTVTPATQLDLHGIITPERTYFVAPYIIVPRASVYWRQQLAEFEAMLNNPTLKEADYQSYFERNPRFLTGIDYQRAIPHPILEREAEPGNTGESGDLIPDFFLQPVDREYVDILDLKLPTEKLIVGPKNRLRHSSSVHEALAQVREYRDYFDDPTKRSRIKEKYGLTAYRPTVAVIIGRSPKNVKEEKIRQIDDQLPRYAEVLTYDQLYAKMKEMVYLYSI